MPNRIRDIVSRYVDRHQTKKEGFERLAQASGESVRLIRKIYHWEYGPYGPGHRSVENILRAAKSKRVR